MKLPAVILMPDHVNLFSAYSEALCSDCIYLMQLAL